MRQIGLSDDAICQAVLEMVRGIVDADLGASVVKKRVALPGMGKRSGVRTIVATNMADRWFFLYGFGKKVHGAISTSGPQGMPLRLTVLERFPIILWSQFGLLIEEQNRAIAEQNRIEQEKLDYALKLQKKAEYEQRQIERAYEYQQREESMNTYYENMKRKRKELPGYHMGFGG